MVIGTGLVAGAFKRYGSLDGFLIFASGVSNSKTSTAADFKREKDLLTDAIQQNPDRNIVYFSTCSIDDPDLQGTPYIQHKLEMENLLSANAEAFHIFRLSNLAGKTSNPNTILNYFYQHINRQQPFILWKYSERNIIDVEDVYKAADHVLQQQLFNNGIINIANERSYPVTYIVQCIETFCGKKAIYEEKEKGAPLHIELNEILPVFRALHVSFGENYLMQLLKKYYS